VKTLGISKFDLSKDSCSPKSEERVCRGVSPYSKYAYKVDYRSLYSTIITSWVFIRTRSLYEPATWETKEN
jgi:hypothetical protein